jgi:hypothetical protein
MDDEARKHLIRELRKDLAAQRIIAVLGAGVSVATSNNAPTASWRGLLSHGIEHCAVFGHPRPAAGWVSHMRWLINNGDMEDYLVVATEIERRLQGDKFRDWISNTIGALPHVSSELPRAINQLNAPVATTNYDDFPAHVVQAGAIPWLDRPDIDQWLKRKDRRYLHLHGVWQRPNTIILGHSSYGRLTADDRTQFIQKVLGTRRLLLIGCGAGLNDPNLGPLLGWLREELSGGDRNDYLLCLNSDAHGDGSFVRVPFGDRYDQLPAFLRTLAPLNARHQSLIDIAQAYEALRTSADGDPVWIDRAEQLIDRLGQTIASQASTDLYDALQDSDEGIGLQLGLVKAIVVSKSYENLHRVVAVSARLPMEHPQTNAHKHLIEAFSLLCPHATDRAAVNEARSVVELWLQNKEIDVALKAECESVIKSISLRLTP